MALPNGAVLASSSHTLSYGKGNEIFVGQLAMSAMIFPVFLLNTVTLFANIYTSFFSHFLPLGIANRHLSGDQDIKTIF